MKNKRLKRANYLIVLLCFVWQINVFSVFAEADGNRAFNSISVSHVTVKQLVELLGKEFKYSFFIVDEQAGNTVVSVNKSNATISEVLDDAFKNKDITYTIKDRHIVISSKKIHQHEHRRREDAKKINGIVLDENTVPIIGASIRLEHSNIGVISNVEGKFQLEVPEEGRLIISSVGYNPQMITLLNNQTVYRVVLTEDTKALDELVVVGYGTQRKGNLTGSVSSVKNDKLTLAPITSVSNALAGQLSGLKTKQTSGIPGADGAALSIRGFNNPLVIVDGVETSFNNIDASQIESITVLKDGAASIYGARAGNGVVLVTLKRGSESKVTVAANVSLTMQNSTKLIRSGSSGQRAEWEREAHINANLPASQIPWTLSQIQKFYREDDPEYLNTDWFAATIRPWAPQQNHNVSVMGGNKHIKFYSYLGYNNQETISRHDGGGYQRINLQTTLDANIIEGVTLSSSANYIKEDRDFTSMNLGHKNYYFALYDSDPRYRLTLPDETKLSYAGTSYGNALFVSSRQLAGYSRNNNHNLRANASLMYKPKFLRGLQVKAFVNYNGYFGVGKVFKKQPDFYSYLPQTGEYKFERKSQDPTLISYGTFFRDDITQQYSAFYENIFNDNHQVSALALHERIDYNNVEFGTQRGELKSSVADQLFAGDPTTASNQSNETEMGRSSYVVRVNYGYKNRYLLETIFRADASAKFPKNGRWGFFPSISLGWVVSEEDFLQTSTAVDNLKLRGSFGQSGDDGIGNYLYYAGYAYDMSYILGDKIHQGLYATGLANPYLSWERLSIYNLGIDYSFFKRKLYGTLEGFYRLREGIPGLRTGSLPSTFGASLPLENINSMDTRGFEFEVGTSGKWTELVYDVSANISWARSKWVKFDESDYTDPDQKRIYGITGKWTDERYGYVSDGLFTSPEEIAALGYSYVELGGNESIRPGDVKYLDTNEDGKLDWRDQVKIGQGTTPNWMFGLNCGIKYKTFDISMLFQGAFGYTSYIDLESAPMALKYESRWTAEKNNKNALVPRPGSKNIANGWNSDYRNHNAAYARLKSLSLGYELSKKVLELLKLTKMRFYVAGTNLFTVTNLAKYGVDPEAPDGTPAYYYPQQRTVSFGMSITY